MQYILLILGIGFIVSGISMLFKREVNAAVWLSEKWGLRPQAPDVHPLKGWQKNSAAVVLIVIGIIFLLFISK